MENYDIKLQKIFTNLDLEGLSKFEEISKQYGFDSETLMSLNTNELEKKIDLIKNLLENPSQNKYENLVFKPGIDFNVPSEYSDLDSYIIQADYYLKSKYREANQIISRLRDKEEVEDYVTLINEENLKAVKEKLDKKLINLNKKKEEPATKFDEGSSSIGIIKAKAELYKEKSKFRSKLLERESIASIVGAILLLIMCISLVLAMFTETTVIKIIDSAFLLILGYFFGQSVSKKQNPS